MTSKLIDKLHEPEYRRAFVASQINIGLPFQIRSLLKVRGKTQTWLAEQTGMLQPRISGLMTPGKTRPNIETLRRVAEAFDCGLCVRFVPFTELVDWSERFDPETFNVPDFSTEFAESGNEEATITGAIASGKVVSIDIGYTSHGPTKRKDGPASDKRPSRKRRTDSLIPLEEKYA